MDLIQDIRHNVQHINNKQRRIILITLFIVQFFFSQLVLSYGIYAVYFTQQNIIILDALWPPILFIATTKISSPWLQVIPESFYEYNSRLLYFIGTLLCSSGVALCYFFVQNTLIYGIFYGIIGGIGFNLVISVLNNQLYDIIPYEINLVLGVHHFGIASGLFVTPLIIKVLIDFTNISYVFLLHGAILLNVIPASLLLEKKNICNKQRLRAYNNLGTNDSYEEEMVDMSSNERTLSLVSRNWKSPSDSFHNEEYIDLDETDNEKVSSPILAHKTNTGVNILPLIIEEDEYETEEDISKRSSMILDNNLKRMSVLSVKFEEIIQKEEENTILEIKSTENNKNEIILVTSINNDVPISLSVDENLNRQTKNSCCTPYQKYRFRRRLKTITESIYKLCLEPIIKSIQIIEFYPSLLTNIHSLLSPLIFLNFVTIRASSFDEVINLTELSFMFPVTAFAYLVFLITLPWITEISKRNLKYIYILGCIISAFGIYLSSKSNNDDYIIISCLIYGFGFGIESYLKETVLKEFLGISKWSKTESTLECLSGILFLAAILILRNIFGVEDKFNMLSYTEQWLDVIFCNHIIVFLIWIVFPLINYLFDLLFYKNRGNYTFN